MCLSSDGAFDSLPWWAPTPWLTHSLGLFSPNFFECDFSFSRCFFEAFYDDNGITIDGHTDLSFTEDVGKRFEGYGWQVWLIPHGETISGLAKA